MSVVSSCGSDTRRRFLAAGALSLLPDVSVAARPALPASTSLAAELQDALRAGKPLVVMVSLDGCVFCRAVRQSHLLPMRAQQGLAVVQVDMQSQQLTRNFSAAEITHDQQVRAWQIRLAPTLLFFGRGGAEIAERLPGYGEDFYSFYLAERLAQAQARIRV